MILVGCKECGCTGVAHHNAQFFYEQYLVLLVENKELKEEIIRLKKGKKATLSKEQIAEFQRRAAELEKESKRIISDMHRLFFI